MGWDWYKDPDARGDTPLHLAASGDSRDVLEWLLTMQPALDQVNKQGDTALHIACRAGHEHIARQLLAAGAATGIRNTGGETALDVAQAECSTDTIALLGQARH
jgi:ankyrin repeat protein